MGGNFGVLWSLFKALPGSFVFRSPQLKVFPLTFFLLSLLVGIVISKYKSKLLISFMSLLIALGIVGFYKGNIFSYWKNIIIPEDYTRISKYFNDTNNNYETVVLFPAMYHGPMVKWNDEIYTSYIMDRILNNPKVVYYWTDTWVPVFLKNAYNIPPIDNLSHYLGSGGVRYVLANKDYVQFPLVQDLSSDKGLTKIISGENIDLYKVSDDLYKSLFYSNNVSLEYKRISPVMHLVSTDSEKVITFNRQYDKSLVLFDNKDVTSTDYYNCNLVINELNLCDVLLLKIKPLVKQPLGTDYKNNWILPDDSSGSYVLYYTPQIYLYLGLIISFVSLIGHVTYLLLVAKKDFEEQIVFN
ncbi:MAG: hypothetical protein WAX66_03120 [Patescibacteria group bacterium]